MRGRAGWPGREFPWDSQLSGECEQAVGASIVKEIEQAIVRRVGEAGGDWFPELAADGTVRLRLLKDRPRSRLYAVTIGADSSVPHILAKVRSDGAGVPSSTPGAGRPSLSHDPLGAAELTALEYDRLGAIARFTADDARFGAVRPLDHLVEHGTILMDYVADETLRRVLLRRTRLHRALGRDHEEWRPWQRVGAWLELFQRSMSVDGLPARQQERQDVVDRFHAYGDYLVHRTGERGWHDLAVRGAELAAAVLPERLPMAVGHGDYAPRNMFLAVDGRLTVFDPLGRWQVPAYEDLCRFLVGVRLLGLQLHTRGAAYSAATVDTLEREVVLGYSGGATPTAPLRCYELLLLLDKWSALISEEPRSRRAALRMASTRQASGFVRAQAEHLLELARSSA